MQKNIVRLGTGEGIERIPLLKLSHSKQAVQTVKQAIESKYAGKSFVELTKIAPDYLLNLKENNTQLFKDLFFKQFGKYPII